MPMFHYVSGVYCYLYFDQMHVNLIWYLYPFMLNKIGLSLSLIMSLGPIKFPSKNCHWTFPMISQQRFIWWFVSARQQTITRVSVDTDLCRHTASLGHNVLSNCYNVNGYLNKLGFILRWSTASNIAFEKGYRSKPNIAMAMPTLSRCMSLRESWCFIVPISFYTCSFSSFLFSYLFSFFLVLFHIVYLFQFLFIKPFLLHTHRHTHD